MTPLLEFTMPIGESIIDQPFPNMPYRNLVSSSHSQGVVRLRVVRCFRVGAAAPPSSSAGSGALARRVAADRDRYDGGQEAAGEYGILAVLR